MSAAVKHGVYIASKTKHAATWRMLRTLGAPIISTWIDEAGVGESLDLGDLWKRCVREASSCELLVLFEEAGDTPFVGAFIEVGAALASSTPVLVVFPENGTSKYEGQSFLHHPLVQRAKSVAAAIATVAPGWELGHLQLATERR